MSTFMVKVDFERPLGDGPHGLPPAIIQMTVGEHLPGVLALAVDRARLTNDGVSAYLMNGDGKREQETPPVYSLRFRMVADPSTIETALLEWVAVADAHGRIDGGDEFDMGSALMQETPASQLRAILCEAFEEALPDWFAGARLTALSTGEDTTQ